MQTLDLALYLVNEPVVGHVGGYADCRRERNCIRAAVALYRDSPKAQEYGGLSGTWWGEYLYDASTGLAPVTFVLTLEETKGRLAGRMEEPATFGDGSSAMLYADIRGRTGGDGQLFFVKTYDGTGGVDHDVSYQGRYDPQRDRIAGTWHIRQSSGTFWMERN